MNDDDVVTVYLKERMMAIVLFSLRRRAIADFMTRAHVPTLLTKSFNIFISAMDLEMNEIITLQITISSIHTYHHNKELN